MLTPATALEESQNRIHQGDGFDDGFGQSNSDRKGHNQASKQSVEELPMSSDFKLLIVNNLNCMNHKVYSTEFGPCDALP